ncbi:hypothetical protein UFOVP667_3 [uncultured Caudovirales phage]|uniref:Uncharacterized protein n=1 Tax=uncultured Caudovirales phage TaxID=2100421 RepID=A0A6J5NA37_9CAUD|nr:hypothetical protein UFOVP667_3 [uncultured Caudovirales phage]
MEAGYIVVFSEEKKGKASAELLAAKMEEGAVIISAVATRDAVHYVLGRLNDPEEPLDPKEARDIIRDNLDAEEAAERRDNE